MRAPVGVTGHPRLGESHTARVAFGFIPRGWAWALGVWRRLAGFGDARRSFGQTFEVRVRERPKWEYSRRWAGPAAGIITQARLPPTARFAPRGARRGLLV